MVWICEKCGQGNIESFTKCIECNALRVKENADLMNCWDFHQCSMKHKNECVVFDKRLGRQCYLYYDMNSGCPGNNHKPCSECTWYEKIINL